MKVGDLVCVSSPYTVALWANVNPDDNLDSRDMTVVDFAFGMIIAMQEVVSSLSRCTVRVLILDSRSMKYGWTSKNSREDDLMGRSNLRIGDLVYCGYYAFLEDSVQGGERLTEYAYGSTCLVLGLGEAVWNEKRQSKRTKRVLLLEPKTCKVGWIDRRWVTRV